MRFDVTLFGDTQFSREIERVGRHAGNLAPVFESVMDMLRQINAEQFNSQGARGSGGWDPLSADYVRWKASQGLDTRIGFATHDLFSALTNDGDPNNETIINEDWAVMRIVGDPGEYGQYFHDKRPAFVLTEWDRRNIVKEIERYVMTGELGQFLDI